MEASRSCTGHNKRESMEMHGEKSRQCGMTKRKKSFSHLQVDAHAHERTRERGRDQGSRERGEGSGMAERRGEDRA